MKVLLHRQVEDAAAEIAARHRGEGERVAVLKVFRPGIAHPSSDSWNRIDGAGLLKPIDVLRLSNWPDLFEGLRDLTQNRDADGTIKFLRASWGNASIIYRTDLYDGEETWCMLFDERYEGRLSSLDSEASVLIAELCQGLGERSFNMSEELLAEVRPLVEKQTRLVRFYWQDQTQAEQALASGEIVAGYAWNAAYKNLLPEGVPVAYAQPKEGILNWIDGFVLIVDGVPAFVRPHSRPDRAHRHERGRAAARGR